MHIINVHFHAQHQCMPSMHILMHHQCAYSGSPSMHILVRASYTHTHQTMHISMHTVRHQCKFPNRCGHCTLPYTSNFHIGYARDQYESVDWLSWIVKFLFQLYIKAVNKIHIDFLWPEQRSDEGYGFPLPKMVTSQMWGTASATCSIVTIHAK